MEEYLTQVNSELCHAAERVALKTTYRRKGGWSGAWGRKNHVYHGPLQWDCQPFSDTIFLKDGYLTHRYSTELDTTYSIHPGIVKTALWFIHPCVMKFPR